MTNTLTSTIPFSDSERKFAAIATGERCWSLALQTRIPDSIYETLDRYSDEVQARYRECQERGLPGFEFEPRRWLDLVRHLADKHPNIFPRLGNTMGHDDDPRPGPHIDDSVIVCQILAKLAGEGAEPCLPPLHEKTDLILQVLAEKGVGVKVLLQNLVVHNIVQDRGTLRRILEVAELHGLVARERGPKGRPGHGVCITAKGMDRVTPKDSP